MEEKKTVLEYISQVFMLYGIMITLELIFCMIFGEAAETYGTMFALGDQGLSVAVLVEFLVIAIIIVAIRALFFTTIIFKHMSIVVRTIGMVTSILIIISIGIISFRWFPYQMWQPWILFVICVVICYISSVIICMIRERQENQKLEEALEKLKSLGEEQNG